jgi:transcriptional regulator with XRE-family HTH domain
MTQEQLAALVEMSVGAISQIEHGKQGYSRESLESIARALNVKPGWLLSRDPNDPADVWSLAEEIRAMSAEKQEQIRRVMRAL